MSEFYDLNKMIVPLLKDEPFYGYISRRTNKIPSTKYPRAAIGLNSRGGFDMFYNPVWFAQQEDKHKTGTIKHELLHPMLGHFTRRVRHTFGDSKDLDREQSEKSANQFERIYAEKINIALDLVINSEVGNELPHDQGLCIPGIGLFKDFPAHKSNNWYLSKLEKFKFRTVDCYFDEHMFPNLTPEEEFIMEQSCKQILRGAYNECKNHNNWGSLSQNTKLLIEDFLFGKIPWEKVLPEFVQTLIHPECELTRTRPNRKLGHLLPGFQEEESCNLLLALDNSASVSENLFKILYREMKKLQKIATFDTVNFDTSVDIHSLQTWEPGMNRQFFRTREGGTDFQCVTDFFNQQKKWDGLIILTDLGAPHPGPCYRKRMWVCDENESNLEFQTTEKVLKIPT